MILQQRSAQIPKYAAQKRCWIWQHFTVDFDNLSIMLIRHLFAPGQPAVPRVGVVLAALDQVVAVVLAQTAEPPSSRKLGRLALQGVEVAGLQVLHRALAGFVLLWSLPDGLHCCLLAQLVLRVLLGSLGRDPGTWDGGVAFDGDDATSIRVPLCWLCNALVEEQLVLRHRRHYNTWSA